ncbi:hypothetical protein V5735_03605 (plasmid) [Haladaptatus sp. SPP-AMP-3]|uniref:hypothetical protein n=1 Tax=Haladaptatus sp. SPP-AMP-3 TaxID=3121295 RepID=UPI003C2CDC0F
MAQSTSLGEDLETGEEQRYQRLLDYDLPDAAIRRYLDQRSIEVPGVTTDTKQRVAQKLDDEQIEALISEYKFAGQQSINYYLITGVERKNYDDLVSEIEVQAPSSKQEVGVREPYLASADQLKGNLYLSFGYIESTGDTDPVTGIQQNKEIRGRCVAVLRDETDLVSIRCTDENIAKKVARQITSGLKIERESAAYQPEFGHKFEEKFRNELIEKYYSLKIRINDQAGRTVDTIEYKAKTDEEGEREDAREDKDVSRQLDEHGGDIRMGYVELKNGSKFYMNRDKSKISFVKCEQEEQINEITEVFDDVLRQTGEYPQQKLEGIGNVPE